MFTLKTDIAILLILIGIQRMMELRLADRNRAIALAKGGIEYGAEHYWIFVAMHSMWMISWSSEGLFLGGIHTFSWLFLLLFVIAQVVRYLAISALGEQWNTRVIIVPELSKVNRGIYKFLRHPNYIAVVIELFSVPMIFMSWRTAIVISIVNAIVLLTIRIPVENKALSELRGAS